MRMLDALNQQAPRRKSSSATMFVLGACAVLVLGAAIPLYGAGPQEGGKSLSEFLTSGGSRDGERLTLLEGTLTQLKFTKAISAIALADDVIATIESPGASGDELRVRARAAGRTNVLIGFKDGTTESYDLIVRRDLSVLGFALSAIHPSIKVEEEPGRKALVLSGTVPEGSSATKAEDAARSFAGLKAGDAGIVNLIRVQAAASALEYNLGQQISKMGAPAALVSRAQRGLEADDKNDVFVLSGSVPNSRMLEEVTNLVQSMIGDQDGKDGRVINQLTVGERPGSIEEVLRRAIHQQLGFTGVTVKTVAGADVHGDTDIVILSGTVPHQTALIRVLALAGRTFQQQLVVNRKRNNDYDRIVESLPGGVLRTTEIRPRLNSLLDDVRVTADESGAMPNGSGAGSGSNETGSSLRSILSTPNGGLGSGGSGVGQLLENRVGSNLARAKAIELAEGRILSFIKVEDIPQVRISIRLFEVSRTDLLNWDSNISKIGAADFDTNGINPNTPLFGADDTIVNNANGDPILLASNTDISNVISFLEGGFTNQIQIGGEHFNLDAVFKVLEREGVARSLAHPTLTVLSGEVAAFADGGSVSISSSVTTSVGGVNGGSTGVLESVQQLPFGIQLAVRPLVDEDGFITLDVAPSVSNPDFALTTLVRTTTGSPQGTVAFAEKNLRTSARVRDGEVLLIGGLQDRSRKDQAGKTPFLGDIPIIGWLFQDKQFEDKDRETMITVSPTIMRDKPSQALLWSYPSTTELLGRQPQDGLPKDGQAKQSSVETSKTPAKPAVK